MFLVIKAKEVKIVKGVTYRRWRCFVCVCVCFSSLSTLDTPSWCHPLMFAPAPEISPVRCTDNSPPYKANLPVKFIFPILCLKQSSSHTDNYPPYKAISFPSRNFLTVISNYLTVHNIIKLKLLEFVILPCDTLEPKKIDILWGSTHVMVLAQVTMSLLWFLRMKMMMNY